MPSHIKSSSLAVIDKEFQQQTVQRIHHLFVRQVSIRPDCTALVYNDQVLCYRDLEERSNQLARHLRGRGVRAGTLVAICLERSPELIITILAVMKAGGAYIPLDPAYPAERIAMMLADCVPPLLVTQSRLFVTPDFSGWRLALDVEAGMINAWSTTPLDESANNIDLACIFYTSGSTGRPKGVVLRHTASAVIESLAETFRPEDLACGAATTSICFDPSILEIFLPLSVGGTVLLKRDLLEPFAPTEMPTWLNGVPSAFALLAQARRIPDSVRVISVGGEKLTAILAREIYAKSSVRAVRNHYGPTEATICTTIAHVPRDIRVDPPIGKAIADARLYVMDQDGKPVTCGEMGELFIGGPLLAIEYLNQPGLTAERFVSDPFVPEGRMYRTGDLVREMEDGNLLFVGRCGRLIKFRGYRIELDEVESALARIPDVHAAAVIAVEREERTEHLAAFVVSDQSMTLAQVRRALRTMLPDYMLPTRLTVLDHLPLSPVGKIDRAALTAMEVDEMQDIVSSGNVLRPVEEVVVGVFRDILRQPFLTQYDDFFDHGGDSLLAEQAAIRLEELLGHVIPASLLYHGRNAQALAPIVQRQEKVPGHITVLQAGGDRTPIFCLPDVFGRPLSFLTFARHFQDDRPIYGLSAVPLEAELIKRPVLAKLTSAYVTEMRKLQPGGPYILAAYSAGAIPAIDIACTLENSGCMVTLILIDPRTQHIAVDVRNWLRRYRRAAHTFVKSGYQKARNCIRQRDLPEWIPVAYREMAVALVRAEADWTSRIYNGRTIIAICRPRSRLTNGLLHLRTTILRCAPYGWARVLKGKTVTEVFDADHYDIMRDPFIHNLIRFVRLHLI
ncbi:amino acid adenylation domain-containing protein [Komagataeibacter diospyri]|uniref:amino acid adenylation domain-containing protein n=1 Tax=Komagataeibacter diospyri TaxID=1932662 RepID=UPI00113ABFB3|nr:amino acid adenylation domain-containing protein [Komagataeibacter diospyri]GCE88509.1 amino acid adenylation domain-containing protein [Komagataeibacter diospyri]